MTQEHLVKWSTSLDISKIQIKMSLRFYLIPARMTQMKNSSDIPCWQGCRARGNTPSLLLRVQNCTITSETNLAVSQKTRNSFTPTHSYTTPGHIKDTPQGLLLNYVHSSFIHNGQTCNNLDVLQLKNGCVQLHSVILFSYFKQRHLKYCG